MASLLSILAGARRPLFFWVVVGVCVVVFFLTFNPLSFRSKIQSTYSPPPALPPKHDQPDVPLAAAATTHALTVSSAPPSLQSFSPPTLQSSSPTHDSHPSATSSPPTSPPTSPHTFNGTWDPTRDARNRLLTSAQCRLAFPDLFQEIDRASTHRKTRPITLSELDTKAPLPPGTMRLMLYDQQLFILASGAEVRLRLPAMLETLNRAIYTSPEPLPNIEFLIGVDDKAADLPGWYPTRHSGSASRPEETEKWLAPDYGFFAWPEPKVHSYTEVRRSARELEEGGGAGLPPHTWARKTPQLVWRGALMGLPDRQRLLDLTATKPWADVKLLDWADGASTRHDLLSMADHCRYRFVAHTEGVSYSGRLKYLLNCRSVLVMPPLAWLEHFHPLLVDAGPAQNYMRVSADYADLEAKMQELLADEPRAERVAQNMVELFRDRYLTEAAEACYWRELVRGWKAVQGWEVEAWEEGDAGRTVRGVSVEDWLLLRRLEWEPF